MFILVNILYNFKIFQAPVNLAYTHTTPLAHLCNILYLWLQYIQHGHICGIYFLIIYYQPRKILSPVGQFSWKGTYRVPFHVILQDNLLMLSWPYRVPSHIILTLSGTFSYYPNPIGYLIMLSWPYRVPFHVIMILSGTFSCYPNPIGYLLILS